MITLCCLWDLSLLHIRISYLPPQASTPGIPLTAELHRSPNSFIFGLSIPVFTYFSFSLSLSPFLYSSKYIPFVAWHIPGLFYVKTPIYLTTRATSSPLSLKQRLRNTIKHTHQPTSILQSVLHTNSQRMVTICRYAHVHSRTYARTGAHTRTLISSHYLGFIFFVDLSFANSLVVYISTHYIFVYVFM